MLDIVIDWLVTRAETEGTEEAGKRFSNWWRNLTVAPPEVNLYDHRYLYTAFLAAFHERMTRTVAAFESDTTAVAIEDDVPPGWSNEDLLAEMEAMARSLRR